jgi:hypothetical protein
MDERVKNIRGVGLRCSSLASGKQCGRRPRRSSRRLITLIFAGRNRTIVIRRELPRTKSAGWAQRACRIEVTRTLLSVFDSAAIRTALLAQPDLALQQISAHQRRRHDFALGSQGGQVPIQHIARGTGFITKSQWRNRFQFSNQPSNGSGRFGIRPKDRTSPLGSATATAIVSAWTCRPTNRILLIGPTLLSLAALRRWFQRLTA